jgi:hypothetical protein
MTHANLGALPAAHIPDEITSVHQVLRTRLGTAQHFSWPQGGWTNITPEARRAVFDAGFISCASAVRGCHVTPSTGDVSSVCIRRDHVLANWPVNHVLYLMMRNAKAASARSNEWEL